MEFHIRHRPWQVLVIVPTLALLFWHVIWLTRGLSPVDFIVAVPLLLITLTHLRGFSSKLFVDGSQVTVIDGGHRLRMGYEDIENLELDGEYLAIRLRSKKVNKLSVFRTRIKRQTRWRLDNVSLAYETIRGYWTDYNAQHGIVVAPGPVLEADLCSAWSRRIAAHIADALVVAAIAAAIVLTVGVGRNDAVEVAADYCTYVFFAVWLPYQVFLNWMSVSVGRRLLGIRIIRAADGSKPSLAALLVRMTLEIPVLLMFPMVLLWGIWFTESRRWYYDRAAGTQVVSLRLASRPRPDLSLEVEAG